MWDLQQRSNERVALGLLNHPVARVHQNQGEVGCRCACDHVARVLHMSRGVCDDELATRRGKVAVRHVNGDALLAFVFESIREQTQIDVFQAFVLGRLFNLLDLILEMLLLSYSSRPVKVDLPSSTLPAVVKRRSSMSRYPWVSKLLSIVFCLSD